MGRKTNQRGTRSIIYFTLAGTATIIAVCWRCYVLNLKSKSTTGDLKLVVTPSESAVFPLELLVVRITVRNVSSHPYHLPFPSLETRAEDLSYVAGRIFRPVWRSQSDSDTRIHTNWLLWLLSHLVENPITHVKLEPLRVKWQIITLFPGQSIRTERLLLPSPRSNHGSQGQPILFRWVYDTRDVAKPHGTWDGCVQSEWISVKMKKIPPHNQSMYIAYRSFRRHARKRLELSPEKRPEVCRKCITEGEKFNSTYGFLNPYRQAVIDELAQLYGEANLREIQLKFILQQQALTSSSPNRWADLLNWYASDYAIRLGRTDEARRFLRRIDPLAALSIEWQVKQLRAPKMP